MVAIDKISIYLYINLDLREMIHYSIITI